MVILAFVSGICLLCLLRLSGGHRGSGGAIGGRTIADPPLCHHESAGLHHRKIPSGPEATRSCHTDLTAPKYLQHPL